MIRWLIVLALLFVSSSHAKVKHSWPPSQCSNGWVDRMTGMCPYRGNTTSRALHRQIRTYE